MARIFPLIFLLAFSVYGQQEFVAIINAEDDGRPPISYLELNHLTDRLREISVGILPKSRYSIMTRESIISLFENMDEAIKECSAASCLVELGRKITADYIAQARIGRFGKRLTIKVELYDSKSGNLVDSFTGESSNLEGLLDILNAKAPGLFRKMPGVASGSAIAPQQPAVEGGIGAVATGAGGAAFEFERSYLVNLSTEPAGAILNFNGAPIASCRETPCKAELSEGSVQIVAVLEQYERKDTVVSVRQNNQSINIKLTPNFGVLEIKPAYSEGVGSNRSWNLSINGKAYSAMENRFSPGNYEVKLSHECYEDISFKAGINKGSREVFDMAKYLNLKVGGLALSAEKGGEPASEAVFVNGKRVGETPFSGSVPVCSEIAIGNNRDKVDVRIAYNQTVRHKHQFASGGGSMVFVKGGTFTMGCTSEQSDCDSDEKPTRRVTVRDFYIGKYEVTQKEWRDVMGSNPSSFKNCGDDCPVESVSWNDVQEFIRKLNQKTGKKYRLPTEAEWEYAARGGSQSKGYKYSGSNNIDNVAWYTGNGGSKTNPVGRKQPNELGIYDMSGNVWEWVSDWYGSNYYGSGVNNNPTGPSSGSYRVDRGGSWFNFALICRVANRDYGHPDGRDSGLGFRLALSP